MRNTEIPVFKSIRQIAGEGLVSEYFLRNLQRNGRLPGVFSGRKFLVNYTQLLAQLNRPCEAERGTEE